MNTLDRIGLQFTRQLVKTPEGRAHLLAHVAQGESSGERAVFEQLATLTHEPELQRLIRRHAADEERHVMLLTQRITELGVGHPELPPSLNLFAALERRLQVFARPLTNRFDVLRAYLLLQVLEERVIRQFAIFIGALRPVDPETASVFEDLRADEVRHLQYCKAITRKYAPTPELLAQMLARSRAAEADAFAENGELSMKLFVERGLLHEPAMVQQAWRAVSWLGGVVRRTRPPTSPEGFVATTTPEPHRVRRALATRQNAIRALMGFDRRTIAVTLVVAVIQLALAFHVKALPWWAIALAAYSVGAVLSHWLGQSIHETSHRLAARTPLANRVLAWVANVPMVAPIAESFHRYHLEHHSHLGSAGRDSDLPLPIEQTLIRGPISKTVWLFFYAIVYFARGVAYARRPTVGEALNVTFMVAVNVALFQVVGPAGLGYLALSTFFGHGLHPVAAHFIHEHFLFEGVQETTSYYGPLNLVTFNVGYHVEHHDFMNVPGWRLPKLRALLASSEPASSHHSWTCVLFEFITRAELGPRARLVRVAQ
jgi:sphingolipid 4-desaturase/C4-monooxygenase